MGLLSRIEALSTAQLIDELERLGTQTKAGVKVSAAAAERFGAVFSCVRVISEDIAKLPIILYRRLPNGGKERATDHWAYRLMHEKPNSWMTPFEFKEWAQKCVEYQGNAFAYKSTVRAEVRELIPIRPSRVTVLQEKSFEIRYKIDGDTEPYRTAKEIFHLRGDGDGVTGFSPITLHRETIGGGMAMQDHGNQLFGNGAQPGGILEVPGRLKTPAQQRLVDTVADKFSHENRFKTMVLEDGAKWHQVGMTSVDAQYLENRKFNRTEIAAIWRIPEHKINNLDRATFNNVEHLELSYRGDCVMPRATRWEERLTLDLLSEAERRTFFFEINLDALARGDMKARGEFYKSMFSVGSMAPNDILRRENMNPIEGGDERFVPMNMVPLRLAAEIALARKTTPVPAEPAPGGAEETDE